MNQLFKKVEITFDKEFEYLDNDIIEFKNAVKRWFKKQKQVGWKPFFGKENILPYEHKNKLLGQIKGLFQLKGYKANVKC